MLALSNPRTQWRGVNAADPCAVFLVKSLLYPVAAVLTLLACLIGWREPVAGPYFLLAVLAFFGASEFLDVAQFRGRRSRLSEFRSLIDIALRWMVVVGFIWTLLRLSGLMQQFNPAVLLTWAFVTPVMLWIGEIAAQPMLLSIGLRRVPSRKAVVVGVTELGIKLDRKLREDPLLHTEIVGFFEDRDASRIAGEHVSRILGSSKEVPAFVLQNDINVVYITLPMNRDPRVLDLLDALRDSTASIYFVPDIFIFNLIQARLDHLSGVPIVAVRESPFVGVHGFVKRLCDVALAGCAIVLLAPVFLAVAAGVRLNSPGPIIFRQKRYGLDGKEITVYKFRSMSVTEDGQSTYTQVSRNDARVTSFGNFLRKTSLDELPQLCNVLEGSMSLVGPRPHAVLVNEQYRRLIPSYMIRHKVKPGITGWAQINGYRGGDDLESMTKRIDFDLEYLRHWSLGLDVMIMIRTAALIWRDQKAY